MSVFSVLIGGRSYLTLAVPCWISILIGPLFLESDVASSKDLEPAWSQDVWRENEAGLFSKGAPPSTADVLVRVRLVDIGAQSRLLPVLPLYISPSHSRRSVYHRLLGALRIRSRRACLEGLDTRL